jgi:D-3-phosphoglycerate dehydrogenase
MTSAAAPMTREWAILNTEPARFSPEAQAAMNSLGRVTNVAADRAYLLEHGHAFDIFFVGLRNVIDRQILSRASNLKCIVTPTTGTDHIDAAYLREHAVDLLSLQGETEFLQNITATAELTWGLLLSLVRRIPQARQDVVDGRWRRDDFGGLELRSKTIGIIGYGRLGRIVARYAEAFRMHVLAFDIDPSSSDTNVELVPLDDLLARADVVSVHLPLNGHTKGLLGRSRIQGMRDGAVIVNTSRGGIIDEEALLDALRIGKIAGAALDVLSDETSLSADWVLDNRLVEYARDNANVIITPHIGGMTAESTEETNRFMIAKLADYLDRQGAKRSSR